MKRRRFNLRFWLGLASTAIVLGAPTSAQATINVVPNPSFEEIVCGASATPHVCGWEPVNGSILQRDIFLKPPLGNSSGLLAGFSGAADAVSDCVPIGPGSHPASFAYQTWETGSQDWDVAFLSFSASFYPEAACTGSGSSSELSEYPPIRDQTWHEVTGVFDAPGDTASARFGVTIWAACTLCLVVAANFDDLAVEDGAEPRFAAG